MRRIALGTGVASLVAGVSLRRAATPATAQAPPLVDVLPADAGPFDYDLVVVGGGSGGLAAAKRATDHGKKVALCDFVEPTAHGTQWGLGGTCVNVGCIPKKLMHEAALRGEAIGHAHHFGWHGEATPPDAAQQEDAGVIAAKADWGTLQRNAEMYIRSLNFGYVMELRKRGIKYFNAFASFTGPHTVECVDRKGQVTALSARRVLLAPGGRPAPLGIPGEEHCVTSDDLFRLREDPGRTLVVGGGYIGLECAGMLHGVGRDVTLMVRSTPLRTMDRDMAARLTSYLRQTGMDIREKALPTKVEKQADGKLLVTWSDLAEQATHTAVYDTVLVATGREARLGKMGLDKAGVTVGVKSGKVLCDGADRTTVPHIYAVGDVVEGVPELTPVATKAGQLLADRLYAKKTAVMDYAAVPTTVFSPLEYGFVGLTEEAALEKLGADGLEVYHSELVPLEWQLPHRASDACYMKLLVDRASDKVLGFHYLGPNAGEVTQGVAVALTCGATKAQFDQTVGIHPTVAEAMTSLAITKRSGVSPAAGSC